MKISKSHCSNRLINLIIFIGLLCYVILYSLLLSLFSKLEIDPSKYMSLLISYNVIELSQFIQNIKIQGMISEYSTVFKLNLINPIVFGIVFYLLARKIIGKLSDIQISRMRRIILIVIILISVLDFSTSLLLLMSVSNLSNLTKLMAISIGVINTVRFSLLLLFMLWLIITMIQIIFRGKERRIT